MNDPAPDKPVFGYQVPHRRAVLMRVDPEVVAEALAVVDGTGKYSTAAVAGDTVYRNIK